MIKEELQKLQKRCTAHNIPFEEHESEGDKHWTVGLPCGREKELIYLHELDHIKRLLAIPFERYVFLGSYVAICSYEEGTIEAGIRTPERAPLHIYTRLLGCPRPTLLRRQNWTLELKTQEGGDEKRVKIGPISDALHTLWYHSLLGESPEPKYKHRYEYPLTLRIEGIQVSQHEQALDLLECIANSLFFQIDLSLNVLLSLVRKRRFSVSITSARQKERTNLQFPQYEYDKAPMDLYWYARSAVGMPLLQFLAYYQTIEYYFSTYSKAEARKRIRGILKDPTFRSDRDTDIGRILSVIGTGHRYSFGSQLKATLQECLDADQLRSFLESDEERKEFFSSKTKGLTDCSIPVNDTTADLRDKVAERIYNIRCKIVHTKRGNSDKEVEFLLPSSKEAELLSFDIELVQYVARQVLITASSPLQIRV